MLQPDAIPPPVTKGMFIVREMMMSPHLCLRLGCTVPGQAEKWGEMHYLVSTLHHFRFST